jgi:hypothetical protein
LREAAVAKNEAKATAAKPAAKPAPATDAAGISGNFVINGYENKKNNWHYVKI